MQDIVDKFGRALLKRYSRTNDCDEGKDVNDQTWEASCIMVYYTLPYYGLRYKL